MIADVDTGSIRLLVIDACGTEGTVALAENDAVVAEASMPGRSASERLVPVVRELLRQQGWPLAGLSAVAVVHGPGSFTGVRVGLSAAKGLCEAAGVPLVAISRLAVLAGSEPWSVLDAGRKEFYLGEYDHGQRLREGLVSLDELREAVGAGMAVVCEPQVEAALDGVIGLRIVPEPGAKDAVGITMQRVAAQEFDDAATVDANYLRRTDAQLFAWARP